MKIAVIAANGRTGRLFVAAALAAGHEVRAGIRGANPFSPIKGLDMFPCDATSRSDVERLLEGQDAVVSFIGHVKGSPARVQTDATKTILAAMNTFAIKRIVSLTGTGVRFPADTITLMDRVLNASISLVDPNRVQDGIEHVDILKASDAEWTVLRVLKLQNTISKPFTLKENGPTKLYVSREDVALAALQVLEAGSFIRKAPMLSIADKKAD